MNTQDLQNIVDIRARAIWRKFVLLYPELAGFECPSVSLNNRYSVTAGRCFVETNHIQLGTKFFRKHGERMLAEILPHEIAHQVDFNYHGTPKNNRWHGTTWQAIMQRYGLEPEPYHNMDI